MVFWCFCLKECKEEEGINQVCVYVKLGIAVIAKCSFYILIFVIVMFCFLLSSERGS